MINEKNIAILKAQLKALGFEDGLEMELRGNICFTPDRFDIRHREAAEPDALDLLLHFEKDPAGGYTCTYYEALLRKQIQVTGAKALEDKMNAIQWMLPPSRIWREIDAVVSELQKLSETDERTASLLKARFWLNTPAEKWIPNLSAIKSQFEISQRFYFFEGEIPITIQEAFRFLAMRWLEKQHTARKKEETKEEESKPDSDKKHRLLLKKKARKRNGLI